MARPDPKAFIRSMPKAPAVDVVKAAKKAGLSVKPAYVERLRIIDRARTASVMARKGKSTTGAVKANPAPTPKTASGPAASSGKSSPKKALVLAIGVGKTTADIIAAAKAKGVSLSKEYVRVLKMGQSQGSAKATKPSVARAATSQKVTTVAAPAKAGPSKRNGRPMSSGTPSDFIRSMPGATSAEIMDAAKKAGLKFSRGLIYMVRTATKGKAPGKSAKAAVVTKAKPGKPSSASPPSGKLTKSAFIRSMPTATPKEIARAAKAKGLVFSEKYVSTIRYNARNAAKAGGKEGPAKATTAEVAPTASKRGPGRPRMTNTSPPVKTTAAMLRKIILEIGVGPVQRLIEAVAAELAAIAKG